MSSFDPSTSPTRETWDFESADEEKSLPACDPAPLAERDALDFADSRDASFSDDEPDGEEGWGRARVPAARLRDLDSTEHRDRREARRAERRDRREARRAERRDRRRRRD